MEFDDIQEIYVKICSGFEKISIDGVDCFLKHHKYSDRYKLKKQYKSALLCAQEKGIKTEKDYLDFYIEKDLWSTSKEDEIRTVSAFIENLKKTREKLILPSQKESVSKTIEEEEQKLLAILSEKKSIMPFTAEEYAEKIYSRYYLYNSIYKDEQFNQRFAENPEYFLEIEEEIYNKLWSDIFNLNKFLIAENIKYVAATGFFQNLLILSGKNMSALDFFGKSVSDLTIYQTDILSYGSSYRRSINNATDTIPEYILNDPINLIDWCEGGNASMNRARSIMENTPNKNKTSGERTGRITSIVGASSSDYKKLGIAGISSGKSDLLSEANNSGGQMGINQVIKKTDGLK